VYELKPEYAGRLLECPVCRRHLRAGATAVQPRPAAGEVDSAFDRDVFLLNQRVFRIASEYEVWTDDGKPILYVQRPTYPVRTVLAYLLGTIAAAMVFSWVESFVAGANELLGGLLGLVGLGIAAFTFVVVSMSARPLRHVTIFRDDSRREVVLRVRQDQRVAVLERTYTITTPADEPLARLRKVYVANLVRKRWYIDTPAGQPIARAIEDSMVLSLLRRVLGPFFGLLRTNFLIERGDGEVVGEFNRKFTLFDRYVLDMRADPQGSVDRRFAVALGIMLDTGERR
jgi:hypothetical protein